MKEKARSQYETTDDAIVVDAVNGRIFEYAQHLRGMDRFFMDMEPEKLKEDFGDKAVFHGAIDQGKILREATAAEIEGELNGKIKELAHSGGDILALAHTIEEYTLVEDLMAMYDFAKKCGQYPVRY